MTKSYSFLKRHVVLVIASCMAMVLTSCDRTEPTAPDGSGGGPSTLIVIAMDASSVKVSFKAKDLGVRQGYRISFRSIGESEYGVDSGSIFVGDFENRDPNPSIEILELTPQLYEFRLSIVTTNYQTLPSYDTALGAPAWRYPRDVQSGTIPLRLYERGSTMGDALVLDPDRLGPTVTTVDNAANGTIALALGVLPNEDQQAGQSPYDVELWVGGIAIANIPSEKADLTSMLGFYDTGAQSNLDDFHVHQFRFASMSEGSSRTYQTLQSGSDEEGKVYRPLGLYSRFSTETPGVFRYTRFIVRPGTNGKFLQGTAPNRYIELDLSIGHPGVPFA
ncbi:MAG: hypothetical protein IPH85_10895 [Ignavibacteria bacterium]|nr:hypothetical protein [Ignavibacteria bacterium]MBK7186405.1 hypothetical protein [Ignavibacteria bacterium]MBK7578382.1 hypothetical protein [Ignavibacteria bacterium]MBK9183067.1 hypothetical protein [Ignavibacteria bacterium]